MWHLPDADLRIPAENGTVFPHLKWLEVTAATRSAYPAATVIAESASAFLHVEHAPYSPNSGISNVFSPNDEAISCPSRSPESYYLFSSFFHLFPRRESSILFADCCLLPPPSADQIFHHSVRCRPNHPPWPALFSRPTYASPIKRSLAKPKIPEPTRLSLTISPYFVFLIVCTGHAVLFCYNGIQCHETESFSVSSTILKF